MFESKKQVIETLSHLPKGEARRHLLDTTNAVDFIASIGSNITLYQGKPTSGDDFQTQLTSVHVILIQRCHPNGTADGIGAFGGLSECIEAQTFDALSPDEKQKCVGKWDNVVFENGQPTRITDIRQISINNVKREVQEELGNIGIHSAQLLWDKMVYLPFRPQDDNYLINRWESGERVCVVRPRCYVLEISANLSDYLITKSNQGIREVDTELSGLKRYALTDVLFRAGQSPVSDYRYPHEWLAGWFLAARLVKGPKAMNSLIDSLKQIPYFAESCPQMRLNPTAILNSLRYQQNLRDRQHSHE